MLKKGNLLHQELTSSAGITEDPARLQELLEVNDQLTTALTRQKQQRRARRPPGLGISMPGSEDYFGNGHVAPPAEEEEEEAVSTPKIDKGKGKAPPEHEPVLSPTAAFLDDSDDSDEVFHSDVETEDEATPEAMASPTDRFVFVVV
jgi:protein phosphatase 1 regulatory subunit 37